MSDSTPSLFDNFGDFDDTEEMSVGDKGFLVERFGNDCSAVQQIRELTQNAIEAIKRCGGAGQIVWDMDQDHYTRTGIPKLSITDNGDGMTLEELRKYINSLSISKSRQWIGGNYGIGAKITAVFRNPFGVIYQSWVNGQGNAVWMHKSSNEPPRYGLRRLRDGDRTVSSIELDEKAKPDMIPAHGTKVTLLGKDEQDDTTKAPDSVMRPSGWLIKYLNTRYFRFPETITIYGSENWNTKNFMRRRVYGQEYFLKKASISSGEVELTGAIAHWWILSETEKSKDRNVAEFMSSGHVAALYQDELYEMTKIGRESTARLIDFGVYHNHNRVVIYVQPMESALTTSAARTTLRQDDDILPWEQWSNEFKAKMPTDIRKLIEEEESDAETKDEERAIRERLKKLGPLYEISRYKRAHGPHEMDPSETFETQVVVPGESETVLLPLFPDGESDDEPQISIHPRKKKIGSGDLTLESLLQNKKKNGVKCRRSVTDNIPIVKWLCAKPLFPGDLKRAPGDLEDRAARWIRSGNRIHANGDFRIFKDMVARIMEERNLSGPGQEKVVWRVVRVWFRQALTEVVMCAESMRGTSKYWKDADVKKATSEEALTSAIGQRYPVYCFAKRDVGTLLGASAPEES